MRVTATCKSALASTVVLDPVAGAAGGVALLAGADVQAPSRVLLSKRVKVSFLILDFIG